MEYRNLSFKQKIHIIELYLVLLCFIFIKSNNPFLTYSPFFVLIFFTIFNLIWQKKIKIQIYKTFIFYSPLIIFFLWLYGVFIGIVYNNKIEFVFRNFFGMSLYLAFYCLLTFEVSIKFLFKMVNIIFH